MRRETLSTNKPHEHRTGALWRMDPQGYCIIKVFYAKKLLGLRHYPMKSRDHDLELLGDDGYEMVQWLVQEGYVSSLQHAAYLGHELQKAQAALKLGVDYVQDESLDFKKPYTKDPSENVR